MKSNKEVPLIYIFIYSKFRKHLVGTPFVRPAYLFEVIKRICRIPKVLIYPILKEMEKFGLVRRINKQSYEILSNNCTNKLKKYHFKSDRIPWN